MRNQQDTCPTCSLQSSIMVLTKRNLSCSSKLLMKIKKDQVSCQRMGWTCWSSLSIRTSYLCWPNLKHLRQDKRSLTCWSVFPGSTLVTVKMEIFIWFSRMFAADTSDLLTATLVWNNTQQSWCWRRWIDTVYFHFHRNTKYFSVGSFSFHLQCLSSVSEKIGPLLELEKRVSPAEFFSWWHWFIWLHQRCSTKRFRNDEEQIRAIRGFKWRKDFEEIWKGKKLLQTIK